MQVLYLEDNPDDAEIVRVALIDGGYNFEFTRVQTRHDFAAALQRGGWGLILADYALPSFDGLSALRMAVEQCPDVPFIMVTGAAGEECAVEALTAGATDYILKGRTSRLAPAVDRVLREVEQRRNTRAAEAALKEREEQYRILFEANPVGLVYSAMTDGIAEHLEVNTAYLNLVGYSRSEFLSGEVPWTKLTPMEYRHLDETAIAEVLATGASTPYEKEYLRKNGERVWVRTRNLSVNRHDDHFHFLTHIEDITSSRQAKEDLRIAEQAFRMLFDEAPVAYHEVDQDGRVVRVNLAECELFGLAASDILGRPISEFVITSQPQRTRDSFAGTPPDGSIALPMECTFHDRNGVDHVLQLHERRITNAIGEVIGQRAAMLDVTEAKRATRQIEFQAKLLGDVNEAIVATDTEFRIIYWNAAAERMFGWSAGDAVGQKYGVVLGTVLTGAEREAIHKKILQSGVSDLELNCVNRQGDSILVLASLSIIRGQNGDAHTVIGIHRDITKQRRTDERLRVLSAAVEQCPVSIVITNLYGDIEYVNPMASELTGYTFEELKGMNPRILKSGATSPEEYSHLWKTIQHGTWQGIFHNKKKNGELFWESATICAIRDGQGVATHFLALKEDITERKAIQEALEASEARFRVAAESTNDLIYEWDLISGIAQIFGSGDKIVPASGPYVHDTFLRMIHPEDRVNVDQGIERHLQTGERFRQEYRVILADGSTRYWLDQGRAVCDAAGKPIRWIGATTDITDRKVAEQLATLGWEIALALTSADTLRQGLQYSAEALVRYMDAAFARIWTLNEDVSELELQASAGMYTHLDGGHARVPVGQFKIGRIAQRGEPYVSSSIAEDPETGDAAWARRNGLVGFAGYPLYVGGRVIGVVAVFGHAPFTDHSLKALATTSSHLAQFITRKRGEQRLLEAKQAAETACTALQEDIERRRRAEAALKQSEEQFRLITETIEEVFWIADVESSRMDYISPGYERVWGRTRESLYRNPREFIDSIHTDDRTPSLNALEFQKAGRPFDHEYRIIVPGGSVKWIWDRGFPVVDGTGRITKYVGVAQDITERKHLEQQLTQAQKLESIGQLAAGIAHEINTPIQYIGDNATFLQDAFKDLMKALAAPHPLSSANLEGEAGPDLDMDYLREEIPKSIEQLQSGVEQVARIVRAMKTFSHPGQVERTPVDLNAAIESTVLVSRNEWKYVADVTTDFATDLPLVSCLAGEVNQVVLNLIINAAHAISDVVKNSVRKGAIRVSTRRNGDWAEIRVADTGGGIPEAIRSKVFDPFFTTKEVGKGTGQGLAIAHAVIVQRHRGTLSFNSEIGVGTTFTVQLPLK